MPGTALNARVVSHGTYIEELIPFLIYLTVGLKSSTLPPGQITDISPCIHKHLQSLYTRYSICTHRDELSPSLLEIHQRKID